LGRGSQLLHQLHRGGLHDHLNKLWRLGGRLLHKHAVGASDDDELQHHHDYLHIIRQCDNFLYIVIILGILECRCLYQLHDCNVDPCARHYSEAKYHNCGTAYNQ